MKTDSRKKMICLIVIVLCSVVSSTQAIDLIVPNNKAVVEGDGNNGFPFLEGSSVHYQQVYDASQFALLGTNSGAINAIGFRYHGNYNTAPMTYNQMAVRLCTTTRSVDNLSTNFADNMGAATTVVFSGKYTLGVTPPPSDGQLHPWPFPMRIPFSVPFQYNPTNGNLLLDIQWSYANLYAGSGPPFIDAVYASSDSVSRVYGYNIYESYIPTNGTTGTIGLVTLFDVSPVVAPAPHLNRPISSGTNVVVDGDNGAPGTVYYALAATNLPTAATNWFPVATNTFDLTGTTTFTNVINTNGQPQFFLLQLQ